MFHWSEVTSVTSPKFIVDKKKKWQKNGLNLTFRYYITCVIIMCLNIIISAVTINAHNMIIKTKLMVAFS